MDALWHRRSVREAAAARPCGGNWVSRLQPECVCVCVCDAETHSSMVMMMMMVMSVIYLHRCDRPHLSAFSCAGM